MFWEKIKKLYFGSPVRALTFTVFIIVYSLGAAYYFHLKTVEKYKLRIDEFESKIDQLHSNISTQRDTGQYANIAFMELSFDVEKRSTDEKRALRLVEYGKFAISKGDYDYARSLLSEANSITETLEANYYMGIVAYMSGRYREAIQFWRPLIAHMDESVSLNIKIYILAAAYSSGDQVTIKQFLK